MYVVTRSNHHLVFSQLHACMLDLQVTHSDKASAVISRAMKKLSIQGSPSHYSLHQDLPGNSKLQQIIIQ